MKTTKSFPVVLFVLLAAQIASAYYCPSTGRWLSRDPMGEPGFETLRAAGVLPAAGRVISPFALSSGSWINRDPISTKKEPNRYAFVVNNPMGRVDPRGLVTYDSCSPDQQKNIEQQLNEYLKKVSDPSFAACMCKKPKIPPWLKGLANDPLLVVKCEASTGGSCQNSCGWSYTFGRTIHVCPQGFDPNLCGPIGCTLYHEMTHMIGHPSEKWPIEVEKCLGCQ